MEEKRQCLRNELRQTANYPESECRLAYDTRGVEKRKLYDFVNPLRKCGAISHERYLQKRMFIEELSQSGRFVEQRMYYIIHIHQRVQACLICLRNWQVIMQNKTPCSLI